MGTCLYIRKMFILPKCVCGEEGNVERLFLWIVFQRDQNGIAEPHVGQQLQAHQPVSCRAVVSIQHLTWVKELPKKNKNPTLL